MGSKPSIYCLGLHSTLHMRSTWQVIGQLGVWCCVRSWLMRLGYSTPLFLFTGSVFLSAIFLALATYQSLYPVTLFAPGLLYLLQVSNCWCQCLSDTWYMVWFLQGAGEGSHGKWMATEISPVVGCLPRTHEALFQSLVPQQNKADFKSIAGSWSSCCHLKNKGVFMATKF